MLTSQFMYLLVGSIICDIIWLAKNDQAWLIRALTILTLILKVSLLLIISVVERTLIKTLRFPPDSPSFLYFSSEAGSSLDSAESVEMI